VRYIIGADEVGYGSLAGPLLTCAVAVPEDWVPPPSLRDSKKMTRAAREAVYRSLYELPTCIFSSSNESIDAYGVGKLLIRSHTKTIQALQETYRDATVILDGVVRLPDLPDVQCVAKADSKFPAVMAAACIAKVNRDRLMVALAKKYPGYAFEENMGYNSPAHLAGLFKLGRCAIHRRSYHIKAYDGARA
jgi:ribonuclease HII